MPGLCFGYNMGRNRGQCTAYRPLPQGDGLYARLFGFRYGRGGMPRRQSLPEPEYGNDPCGGVFF